VTDLVHVLIVGDAWAPAQVDGDSNAGLEGLDGFAVTCVPGLEQTSGPRHHYPDPSVVVLDQRLSGMSDWSAIQTVHAQIGNVPIAIAIDEMSADDAWAAMNQGVTGIILKSSSELIMRSALTMIASGEIYLCGSIIQALRASTNNGSGTGDAELQSTLGHLTGRQLECIRLLTGGLTNLQIAEAMTVSEMTVKLHLHSAFKKMGAHNRADAVRIAFLHGIVPH
jgi:DNA-binding NarL/FixJ family response regulator